MLQAFSFFVKMCLLILHLIRQFTWRLSKNHTLFFVNSIVESSSALMNAPRKDFRLCTYRQITL